MEPTTANNSENDSTTEHEHESASLAEISREVPTAATGAAEADIAPPTADTAAFVASDATENPATTEPSVASDANEVQTEVPPVERALDFAFGVGLLTAESLSTLGERLGEAAQQMQDQAPDFIREMQEKGRPTRERVLSDLQNSLFAPLRTPDGNLATGLRTDDPDLDDDAFDGTDEDGNRLGVNANGSESAPSNTAAASSSGASSSVASKSFDSAEAEIQRLEDRVRQLEEQTSQPEATTVAVASMPSADLETGATAVDDMTTADSIGNSAPAPGTIESDDDRPKPETMDGGNI